MMEDAEREEWEIAPQADTPSIAPEDQDRFRSLLTELAFCGVGAPVLGFTGAWLHDPITPPWARSASPLLWKVIVYEWLPPFMWFLAFVCIIWAITIPLRMAGLKKPQSEG